MNRALEFHDSTLASIKIQGEDVLLRFAPAYVHESKGMPGIDRGIGLAQEVEVCIQSGTITTSIPKMPIDVTDGILVFRGKDQRALISVPLLLQGPIRLELMTRCGHSVSIEGIGIKTIAIGPSKRVEHFAGVVDP